MNESVMSWTRAAMSLAVVMVGLWLRSHKDRKISVHGYLVMAVGYSMQLVGILLSTGDRFFAGLSAACVAWCLYKWWNGGGGDGMKRRLKSWAQSFGGAAPKTA